ncbi:PilZ domain-containing protein [Thalassotalea sp. PLHSN55]|uniref:PilZ domain-containing protein n=1 Tax=Thalassotalea sp. PLHSN55 TaxID=3435888 RepID=UPI003F868D1C
MTISVSSDLVAYRTIILSLISYAQHPKLDTLIEKLTPKTNAGNRFLIKMEIKRLAKPCAKTLDYRLWFDNCEPVQHENLCHYLDEISKSLFLESIKANNGQFTLHCYNEISEQAKERHLIFEKEKRTEIKRNSTTPIDSVKTTPLVNKNLYREPNVDYSPKCKVFAYDPTSLSRKGREEIGKDAQVVDLNMLSCVLTSEAQAMDTDASEVFIWLYEHHKALNIQDDIILVCGIEEHKKTIASGKHHYRLHIKEKNTAKTVGTLTELINRQFELRRDQHHLKITPLVGSVLAKAHQQFAINSTSDIAMVCRQENNHWRPSNALKTTNNQALWRFLSVDEQDNIVSRIFGNAQLQKSFEKQEKADFYAYIFRLESSNSLQFAVIWQDQLAHDPSALKFIKQHLNHCDYRFIKLSIKPIDALHDAYVPSAMPNHVNSAMAILNRPLTQGVKNSLSDSSFFAVLSDVTEINSVLALPKAMAVNAVASQTEKIPLKFSLPQRTLNTEMAVINVDNNELRSEDRFEYPIDLVITRSDKTSCKVSATSQNISAKGMSILLKQPHKFKPGAELHLTLKMPYRGAMVTLNNQKYQVIGNNDNHVVRLTVSGLPQHHTASRAIREFIYQNLDHLKPSGMEPDQVYGLSQALQNIYANNHLCMPFFIHQNKQKWFINSIALTADTNIPTLQNSDAFNHCATNKQAISHVVSEEKFQNHCLSVINKVNSNQQAEVFYLIVVPRKDDESQQILHSIGDLQKIRQSGRLPELMNKITAFGTPTILRVKISQPEKIFDKTYRDELSYLEQLSPYDAEEVLDEINHIAGIGEITDHSQQVLASIDKWLKQEELLLLLSSAS